MTLEEAKKRTEPKRRRCTANSADLSAEFKWDFFPVKVVLFSGNFTADELEAIAVYMRANT